MNSKDLTFRAFASINILRCVRWHDPKDWSPAEWTNALAGEAGELCNVTKKILRHDKRIQQLAVDEGREYSSGTRAELLQKAANEIADVYTYLDLVAQRLDLDLQSCVVRKFNAVSEREGFPERIETRYLLPSEAGE